MIQPVFGLAKEANASDANALAECYGNWTGVRSNHVVGATGSFSGADGSSRSISTVEDRDLLLALRSRADLIIVDAATARLEKYRTPSSGAKLAIFSLSGNFSDIPAVESGGRILLFSLDKPVSNFSNPEAVHVITQAKPFDGFQHWANSNGHRSILLEAGPTLTRYAFEARLVRQSALTLTSVPISEKSTGIVNPFDSHAQLMSLALADGVSFSLWNH